MVFFVCEGCNETLKKNQVDKHANQCRNCYAVTCVDCSVTFHGNDYAAHTSCISEAQKYEGSLYKPKAQKKNPQDAWMDIVYQAAESPDAPANIIQHLPKLAALSNIPRNKNKFANFVKNSLKMHNTALIDAMFDYLDSFRANQQKSVSSSSSSSNDSISDNQTVSKNDNNKTQDEPIVHQKRKGEDESDKEAERKRRKKEKKARKELERVSAEEVQSTAVMEKEIVEDSEKKKKKHKKDKKLKMDVSE
jgi:cell growth-regulating nucleolar protein